MVIDSTEASIYSFQPDARGPARFKWGDVADAEPAVPGWRLAVDTLFA
ncbi:MAG: hypothetical protein L0241_13075 [Planctomycetia bacterium]|nr:hypothetical protein [Planctomycetia bacterium]